MKKIFKIKSSFQPSGDQPKAIGALVSAFQSGEKQQTLLGVTGSGKTFTMAHLISKMGEPALILAPNKTLAAQLFAEFRELFPDNAVEYFVSYYDYYQPEAYIPVTDTYIEKDSSINEQIDRMRHSATHSLLNRKDVIIISSVSCIYGLGSPEAYQGLSVQIQSNKELKRDQLLRDLVKIQYTRGDYDFHRGTFRVRGDVVDIFPPYEESRVIRVEFFGDFVEKICWFDPLTGEVFENLDQVAVYPGSHHVNTEERREKAIETIREELQEHLAFLKETMKYDEAKRLEQRTCYDIEMIQELGFCQGIENYSRHFTGRNQGEPPPTLLEYFPDQFIMFIDESHVTVPQIGGMYRGDRARKMTLVEHGFRLPSALDNRPLNFQEFEKIVDKVVYVSATPGNYEREVSRSIVEQIIRPTGLVDPVVEVRPATHQVDDLLSEIKLRVKRKERVLVTTLTKKSAEDLTSYFNSVGVQVRYLHSDIKTIERNEIIRDLRLGLFDVLIGINLLREGLDIPEVSLVAVTDADKEGFLRSERSLIQTIGRAARHAQGQVILYGDRTTESMRKAIEETDRRRQMQEKYNKDHGIIPKTIKKKIMGSLTEIYESHSTKKISDSGDFIKMVEHPGQLAKEINQLKKKMKKASELLEFEEAARLRDKIKRLQLLELKFLDGSMNSDPT